MWWGWVTRQVGYGDGPRWARPAASEVASTDRGPVGRAGAYFKRLALHCAAAGVHFAKPSVMQGVPLPTRAARAPPEGKVERGAVVRSHAPPLHAPRLSEVPSVV
ncbi:unnamed protein product [Diatraea saccharalis]|uniref:Uncharacterized protein n=1 Tax=Diatraea saccharalis TaxID=40085 RepID=A0A9P0G2T4_9NEOP|nr:unnamed protein product [Diatraea saccharalis]